MRASIVLCCMVLTGVKGFCQRDSISFFVTGKVHTGFVITHKPELTQLSKRAPISMQVDLSLAKNTQRAWKNCNCYSKSGVSFNYVDFGNKQELGNALAAVLFIEPYLSFNKRAYFSFRAGVGPAYLNQVYDKETNPDNLFFSMHLSYLITLNTNLYIRLTPRTRVVLTAQFNHISNGGTLIPNYGINFPTTGVGLEYNINPKPLQLRSRVTEYDRSLKYVVHAFVGPRIAEEYPPHTPAVRETFAGVNVGVLKPIGTMGLLGVGAEWYHDKLASEMRRRLGTPFQDNIAAVSLQYYVFFGKMFFSPQVAYYLTPHNPNVDTKFYQRYFVGYRITKNWFAGVTLKTHLEVADHAAFATGVIF